MRVRPLVRGDLAELTTMVIEFERFLDAIDGKKRRHDAKRMAAKLKASGFGRRRDRKSTRLNSSHVSESRMPSSA